MAYPGAPSFQIEAAETAYAVTPSDTFTLVAFPVNFKYLYIGGAGNVTLVDTGGNTVTFTALPVGTQLFMAGKYVRATGTTATNIVAMV